MTDKADNRLAKTEVETAPLQNEALQLFQDSKTIAAPQNGIQEQEKNSNLPKFDIVDPNFKDHKEFKDIRLPKDADKIIRNPANKELENIMKEVMDPVIYGRPGKDGKIEHYLPKDKMDNFTEDLKDGELSKENLEYLKKVMEKAGPERVQWLVDQINKQLAEKDVHTRLGIEQKLEAASPIDRINGKLPYESNTYVTVAHFKDGKGSGFSVKASRIASSEVDLPKAMPMPKPPIKIGTDRNSKHPGLDPDENPLKKQPIDFDKYRKRY